MRPNARAAQLQYTRRGAWALGATSTVSSVRRFSIIVSNGESNGAIIKTEHFEFCVLKHICLFIDVLLFFM